MSTLKRFWIVFTVHAETGNDVITLNQPSHLSSKREVLWEVGHAKLSGISIRPCKAGFYHITYKWKSSEKVSAGTLLSRPTSHGTPLWSTKISVKVGQFSPYECPIPFYARTVLRRICRSWVEWFVYSPHPWEVTVVKSSYKIIQSCFLVPSPPLHPM